MMMIQRELIMGNSLNKLNSKVYSSKVHIKVHRCLKEHLLYYKAQFHKLVDFFDIDYLIISFHIIWSLLTSYPQSLSLLSSLSQSLWSSYSYPQASPNFSQYSLTLIVWLFPLFPPFIEQPHVAFIPVSIST